LKSSLSRADFSFKTHLHFLSLHPASCRCRFPKQSSDHYRTAAIFQRHQHRSVFAADAFAVSTAYSLAEHTFKRRIGITVTEISVFHSD
jgi:hypothetical protein